MTNLHVLGKRVHRKVNLAEVIRIKGDINYSEIIMVGGKKCLIAKTLKKYEQFLSFPFFRGNKSFIVNLNFLKNVNADCTKLYLNDGFEMNISRRKRLKLIEILNKPQSEII